MPTVQPEQNTNAITGVPEVDTALLGLMKVLPKDAAPQLEALVVALENTFNAPPAQQKVM